MSTKADGTATWSAAIEPWTDGTSPAGGGGRLSVGAASPRPGARARGSAEAAADSAGDEDVAREGVSRAVVGVGDTATERGFGSAAFAVTETAWMETQRPSHDIRMPA